MFIFILTFLLRIPFALGMIAACILYFMTAGMDPGMVAEIILNRIYANYVIMCAPLFIFTANVMNTGKVTDNIFKFAKGLVGGFKGGLAHVNVIASLIFSGMSGSAIADASGLGIMEIEAMRQEGYEDEFSCAITAASATIGPVFPPSIPMVIYAMLSGASLGELFLAGVVPGVLLAIALMIYIAYIANKKGYPVSGGYAIRDFLVIIFKALPALLTPVILLGGIYTGVMTPTEAGAVAAFYSLLISFFVYRTMGIKALFKVFVETVKTVGMLGLLVGGAFGLSYIVAAEQIPQVISNFVLGITENKYVFLMLVNIMFLVLGMFVDTSVIQLVFIPIALPLVQAMGIDLVHFGIITTLNMMIGLSTPPFGMLLFIVSGISDTPLGGIIKETMPMVCVMLLVLFFVTYFPEFVLFIPNMFFGG